MSILSAFSQLNFTGITKAALSAATMVKIWNLVKDIIDVVSTVEKMMDDGVIDASERKQIASQVILIIAEQAGIFIDPIKLNTVIDAVVIIIDMFNKKGDK